MPQSYTTWSDGVDLQVLLVRKVSVEDDVSYTSIFSWEQAQNHMDTPHTSSQMHNETVGQRKETYQRKQAGRFQPPPQKKVQDVC
eukprot:2790447-Amphidinium_carterae.1